MFCRFVVLSICLSYLGLPGNCFAGRDEMLASDLAKLVDIESLRDTDCNSWRAIPSYGFA